MGEFEKLSFNNLVLRIQKKTVLVLVIIICATIIPLVVGFVFYKPLYETRTGIIVEMPGQYEDSIVPDNTIYTSFMKTYMQIAKTRNIAEKVSLEIDGITVDELLKSIDVTTEESSLYLYISVKHKDPDLSYKVANVYAKAFKERSDKILPKGKLTIFDITPKPSSPINSPINTTDIIVGFIIGSLLAGILAYLIEEIQIRNKSKSN